MGMKKTQKIIRKIFVFVVCTIFMGVLLNADMVEAASRSLAWPVYLGMKVDSGDGLYYRTTEKGEIHVQKGQKYFYIGDYVYETGEYQKLSRLRGVRYDSKNSAVASVNATTGLVNLKKSGSTVISMTYQGISTKCKVVVEANRSTKYVELKKRAEALAKSYGTGITEKNCYKVSNELARIETVIPTDKKTVNVKGFAYKNGKLSNSLEIAALGRYETIKEDMDSYMEANDPIGINSKACFKISNVKASGKQIEIKLSQKVSASQIFAIKKASGWDSEITCGNTAQFPMYVADTSTGYKYYAIATATKGSNIVKVNMYSKKLKNGRKYVLVGNIKGKGSMKNGWTKGRSFTANN